MDFQTCKICLTEKPETDFYFSPTSGKRRRRCKLCQLRLDKEARDKKWKGKYYALHHQGLTKRKKKPKKPVFTKICRKCKQVFPIEEFFGLTNPFSRCKECRKIDAEENAKEKFIDGHRWIKIKSVGWLKCFFDSDEAMIQDLIDIASGKGSSLLFDIVHKAKHRNPKGPVPEIIYCPFS